MRIDELPVKKGRGREEFFVKRELVIVLDFGGQYNQLGFMYYFV